MGMRAGLKVLSCVLIVAGCVACGSETEPEAQPDSTGSATSTVDMTSQSSTVAVTTPTAEVTVPSSADDITVTVASIDVEDNPTRPERQVVAMSFQVSNQTDGSWGGTLELGGGCVDPFERTESSYPDKTVLEGMGLSMGDDMSIPAGMSDLAVARPVSWPQTVAQCPDGSDVQVFVGLPADWNQLTVGGDGQLVVDPDSGTRYFALGSLAALEEAIGSEAAASTSFQGDAPESGSELSCELSREIVESAMGSIADEVLDVPASEGVARECVYSFDPDDANFTILGISVKPVDQVGGDRLFYNMGGDAATVTEFDGPGDPTLAVFDSMVIAESDTLTVMLTRYETVDDRDANVARAVLEKLAG